MLIGKRISDRYKIMELIGGGGMANVYLARDIILERDVAVKILRVDYANDEEFIRRFHREAQSAISLVHPNIVSIYDVGEEDNIYYIVMEYVAGETLKQYIQKYAPLPVDKAIDIMLQLTSAIRHAHENNIIHRDIKPQNILIDKKGNVKITDFGIAVALTSTTITQTNSVLGSVHYISPEQARGGVVTYKSDIYSLGIVMFEMLTGRVPFQGESAVSIALKQLHDETPAPKQWNPTLPQSVENIVLKATTKDPIYRYDDVYEMEENLRTCLNPERLNEMKFQLPVDEEATKAIPIIKEDESFADIQETVVKNPPDEKKAANSSKSKKKRKKWPIVIISLSIIIVLSLVLFFFVFPGIFGPDELEVPDVTGKEVEEAISELEKAGLAIGQSVPLTDDEIPEDHVIRTDPKAGRMVKEGTEINLYVSSGKEKLELSDYTGRNFDDVFNLLQSRDFKDIIKNEVNDDSEPGTILEQNPAPGEQIVPGDTELIFTVSKGPEKFALADLTNYSENALNEYAESRGIEIHIEGEEYDDNIPKGLVIRQDIKPGTEIKKGDKVNVVISKGKEPLPAKTVTVTIHIPYTADPDSGRRQEVQIYIQDLNQNYSEPYTTFSISEPVTRNIELFIDPETRGKYKVVVDGTVVEEKDVNYPR